MADTNSISEIKQAFYDIESLNNVFSLCNYKYNENCIDVYLLTDNNLTTEEHEYIIAGNTVKTSQFLIGNRFVDVSDIVNQDADCLILTDALKEYISQIIYEKNKNFNGQIYYHDLHELQSDLHLINMFGAKDDNGSFEKLSKKYPEFTMFVNDTDSGYSNNTYYYLMGYNSFNYDTTMYALYVSEAFWLKNGELNFKPPTARQMREYNNQLFTPAFKERMPSFLTADKSGAGNSDYNNRENIIRNYMIRSGRYIDVALLNEKMQKVALKRVLGMLGFQILESDKLKDTDADIKTIEELAELIAYNVSDVVNLHELFMHPVYQGNFELKKGLLESYPELIYDKQKDSYKPDIRPDNVRRDRLYIDSSSAKLAARTLCPYGHLNDIETVSFMYPNEAKAKELGIPRRNILDETRKMFYNLYPDRPDLQTEFDRIFNYYRNNIEGRNFNDSDEYAEYWKNQHPEKPVLPAYSMSEIPKCNLTLPYYDKDGNPSSCYVTFGVGGIHGAEYNKALYESDIAEYNALEQLFDTVKAQFPNPIMLKQKDPVTKKAWSFTYNGKKYKPGDFLKSGATQTHAEWKDISKKKPVLFKQKPSGGYELNKKYVYTSNADSSHEDFTSYYPNLLIMMMAFLNEGLGYDRYEEIFQNKQKYGKLMKDKSISDAERYHYDILRNGTKLILNSASGAADAAFFTPIRMNNQIMSMRIIGQLFTYSIGQAQTYAGASIISTNTDGLYSVYDFEENAKILAREAENIHVQIEPEFCHLVSKDSNNRIEINEKGGIITASGGSLACYKRPNPTKSLAHAAIIDWAMCEYLRNVDNIHCNTEDFMMEPFDMDKGRVILYNARFAFPNKAKYLNMFQTIIASSIGSQTYIFGETENLQNYKEQLTAIPFDHNLFNAACESNDINIMQHYNRIFFVNKDFHDKYNMPVFKLHNAAARAITPAQKLTRSKNNEREVQHDPYAIALLEKFGLNEKDIPTGKEAKITKVSGISEDWYVYINNHSLFEMSDEEAQLLINNLNMDNYLQLLSNSFNKNWTNCKNIPKDIGDDSDEET